MYYYSTGSKAKVVHLSRCFHMRNIDESRIRFFPSLESAREHGYRLCNHCAPINEFLNGHRAQLTRYGQKRKLSLRLEDGCICVETPHSAWKIITNGKAKKHIFLYHKNVYEPNAAGFVPGYHSQSVRCNSILEYLKCIHAHDAFRSKNPLASMRQPAPPPRKGTKRWHKEQRRQQAIQRKQDIQNTLLLIEQLSSKGERTYG